MSFILFGCKDFFNKPKNENVLEKENSFKVRDDVFNNALPELLDLYTKRTKDYDNYEVYNRGIPFSVNWRPKLGYLFIQNDRCEWGYKFLNVDENKIKAFINVTPYILGGDDISKEYFKFFEPVDSKIGGTYKKYINTNVSKPPSPSLPIS